VVYGLAARQVGLSIVEAVAMSVVLFAGASQFAATLLVGAGAPWGAIMVLTSFLNSRHALYAAALAPWLIDRPRWQRALMAHVLTDESFALALTHFRRIGRGDAVGYWIAAAFVFVPWVSATLIGYLGGEVIPEPRRLGLDVVFPAAMAGLGIGLITARPALVAAVTAAAISVPVGLAWDPSVGVVVGGLFGPLAGLAVREASEPAS
jgi:branched chain amino acid efflux pump